MRIQAPAKGAFVRTTSGVSLNLGPSEIRTVAPFVATAAAAQHGCTILADTEDEAPVAPAPENDVTPVPRSAVLEDAIKQLIEDADPATFSTGDPKRPLKGAVAALVDFDVSVKEINEVYGRLVNADSQ